MAISKLFLLFILLIISINLSCSNSQKIKESKDHPVLQKVDFAEERRLNFPINLNEATIITTVKELTELYSKLEDTNVPRSAPIPVFNEQSESFIILKPKLTKVQNGDIEIIDVKKDQTTLIINYREIQNFEYSENNWNNPILVIKVSDKPSKIKLIKNN